MHLLAFCCSSCLGCLVLLPLLPPLPAPELLQLLLAGLSRRHDSRRLAQLQRRLLLSQLHPAQSRQLSSVNMRERHMVVAMTNVLHSANHA